MQQVPVFEGQPYTPIPPLPAPSSASAPRRRNWYVILLLCFFAAVIPETLVTTSTSVAKIITHVPDLLFVIAFYGPADLLIREMLVRRRLGWVSLALAGVAFGLINEGVIAGTWYTVRPDGYAFIGQIDYAWAAALTVFHVFISVVMPIAFIEALFPSRAGLPLLRRRGIVLSAVFFLLVSLLFLFIDAYRPYRIAVFALALLLAVVAFRLPPARPRQVVAKTPLGLWRLRLTGFFAMFGYFLMIYLVPPIALKLAMPHVFAAQVADIVVFLGFSALAFWVGRRWTARAGWSARQALAIITGAMAVPLLIALLPPLWPTLELFALVPFFVVLIVQAHRLRSREQTLASPIASYGELHQVWP
jgi:hypothetical protein